MIPLKTGTGGGEQISSTCDVCRQQISSGNEISMAIAHSMYNPYSHIINWCGLAVINKNNKITLFFITKNNKSI